MQSMIHSITGTPSADTIIRTRVCAHCGGEWTNEREVTKYDESHPRSEVEFMMCVKCLSGPLSYMIDRKYIPERRNVLGKPIVDRQADNHHKVIFENLIRNKILHNEKYRTFLESSIVNPSSEKMFYKWNYEPHHYDTYIITPRFFKDIPPAYTP